jgi:hypothetical protein
MLPAHESAVAALAMLLQDPHCNLKYLKPPSCISSNDEIPTIFNPLTDGVLNLISLDLTDCLVNNEASVLISSLLQHPRSRLEDFKISSNCTNDMTTVLASMVNNTSIKRLEIRRVFNAQYWALVAEILRNPNTALEELDFGSEITSEELVLLSSSLVHNKTLKKLRMDWRRLTWRESELVKSIVCNNTNIQTIALSNHTLEEMVFDDYPYDFLAILKMNKNGNKKQVIRSKITDFCQVDKFDTTPFEDIPLVLIPDFLELVPNEKRHNTWYQTLRAFPEMCSQ